MGVAPLGVVSPFLGVRLQRCRPRCKKWSALSVLRDTFSSTLSNWACLTLSFCSGLCRVQSTIVHTGQRFTPEPLPPLTPPLLVPSAALLPSAPFPDTLLSAGPPVDGLLLLLRMPTQAAGARVSDVLSAVLLPHPVWPGKERC